MSPLLNEISHLRHVTCVSALEKASWAAAPLRMEALEPRSVKEASWAVHVAGTAVLAQFAVPELVGRTDLSVGSSA